MRSVLIIGLIAIVQTVQAQSIYMSGRTNGSAKHAYSKVIGENNFGIYILKFRDYELEKDFIIERFSADLNLLESQSYKLNRREKVLKFILTDSFIHCVTETKKTIEQYKIDFTLQNLVPVFKSIPLPSGKTMFDETKVEYSLTKNHISITFPYSSNRNIQLYSTTIRNLKYQNESNHLISTAFNYRECKLVSTLVTDQGKFSLLYSRTGRENRKEKEKFYWISPNLNPSKAKANFMNPYKNLQSAKIYYHPKTKKSSVLALYNFGSKGGSQGVAIYNEDFPDESINSPYEDKVINSVEGASSLSKDKTVADLFIRFATPHANGSFLVVLEKYFVSKEIESFYANGIPQTSTRNIYNYGDIVLIQFDSMSQTSWSGIVHKKQSTMGASTYYSSFLFMVSNQETSIVYNEKGTVENRLLMNRFTQKGQHKVQVLVEPSADLMLGIPIEGRQVTYNSFVMPVVNGRSQNLIKVVF